MNKKEIKVLDDPRQNIQIIHDNFFLYLKKRGMTQTKYSELSGIPQSTISKWKSLTSAMNEDHIRQAADIFEITVNDLYYNDEDKKKIKILIDSPYDPIMATQQIEINMMNQSFKKPSVIIYTSLALSIIIAIIVFFITKFSPLWCLLTLYIPFFARIDFKQEFGKKKTYSINYLDDVYYQIENEKNQYYDATSAMHAGATFLIYLSFLIVLLQMKLSDVNFYNELIFIVFGFLACIVTALTLFTHKDKKLKKKIYDNEIGGYISKLVNLYIHAMLIVVVASLVASNFEKSWYIGLMCFAGFILSLIEFILTSKKYNEYEMVYEEFGKEPRKLFPDNYMK